MWQELHGKCFLFETLCIVFCERNNCARLIGDWGNTHNYRNYLSEEIFNLNIFFCILTNPESQRPILHFILPEFIAYRLSPSLTVFKFNTDGDAFFSIISSKPSPDGIAFLIKIRQFKKLAKAPLRSKITLRSWVYLTLPFATRPPYRIFPAPTCILNSDIKLFNQFPKTFKILSTHPPFLRHLDFIEMANGL